MLPFMAPCFLSQCSGPRLLPGEPAPSLKAAPRWGWGAPGDCLGAASTVQGPSDHPDPLRCSGGQPRPPEVATEPLEAITQHRCRLPLCQLQSPGSSHLTKNCPSHSLPLPIGVLTLEMGMVGLSGKIGASCPRYTPSCVTAQQILHARDTGPENGGMVCGADAPSLPGGGWWWCWTFLLET